MRIKEEAEWEGGGAGWKTTEKGWREDDICRAPAGALQISREEGGGCQT